nr:uncharacterized protein LOC128702087 isoform X1 [Cherax quadricarinatus]
MNFWSRTPTLFQRCSGRIPATSLVDATHENKKAGSAICDALRTLVTPSLIGSEIRLLVREWCCQFQVPRLAQTWLDTQVSSSTVTRCEYNAVVGTYSRKSNPTGANDLRVDGIVRSEIRPASYPSIW